MFSFTLRGTYDEKKKQKKKIFYLYDMKKKHNMELIKYTQESSLRKTSCR